jgi:hypothetical protein
MSLAINSFTASRVKAPDSKGPVSVTLTWDTTAATGATMTGIGQVDTSGQCVVVIECTTTFTLTAFDASQRKLLSQSIQVSVTPDVNSLIPSNSIIPYTGSVAPSGWSLCDGSASGVPDLRSKFICGASQSAPYGNSGTADSHDHSYNLGSLFWTTETSQDPGHVHTMPSWGGHDMDGNDDKTNQTICIKTDSPGTYDVWTGGSHLHDVSITVPSGTAQPSNQVQPPCYAFCFIMKVASCS